MESYRYAREENRVLNIHRDPNNNWITGLQLYERATRRLRVFGQIYLDYQIQRRPKQHFTKV